MSGGFARRLAADRRGAATIEFAVSATALILVIVGILGTGLAYWSWQALEGAAIDAARCAAINSTSCKNVATSTTATVNYAVAAATTRGLPGMTASNVAVTTGAGVCGSGASASVVSVVLTYNFGALHLPNMPTTLSASACFPLVSSSSG